MSHQENIISAQIDGGLHEKQALLDDFAKAAMQGMVSGDVVSPSYQTILATAAYDVAEALMQERERRMKR